MLGQTNQMFTLADLDYRRDRLINDLQRNRRPLSQTWPISLFGPRRRRPRIAPRPRPAPHHALSH
ncbi:MAG TPA: hypothetical protein VHV79_01310 [Mycobacteriales bacterium]|jgi:hypothetical protein|nr:hypothetical protein [Mycobacteriales bacterium]